MGSTNPPLEQWTFIKLPNPRINWISDEINLELLDMQISFVDMQMRPGGLMGLGSWGGRGGKGAEPCEVQLPPGKSGFNSRGIPENSMVIPKPRTVIPENGSGMSLSGDKPAGNGESQQCVGLVKTRNENIPEPPLSCLRFPGIIPGTFSPSRVLSLLPLFLTFNFPVTTCLKF